MIKAFGVSVFTEAGATKPAPVAIGEINQKLVALGISDEAIITVQKDEAFFHVFYRQT